MTRRALDANSAVQNLFRRLSFVAGLFAVTVAFGYDLFSSGYPPRQTVTSSTGTVAQVASDARTRDFDALKVAMDSRFRTVLESDGLAVRFSSVPPAFCISIR